MTDNGRARAYGDIEAAAEAFEQLPFNVIVTEGPDARLVAFNAVARQTVGDRLVRGVPVAEALPQEAVNQAWLEVYTIPTTTGQNVTIEGSRAQVELPDGSVTEFYIDVTSTPLTGPDGRPRGAIMVGRDATARVLRQQATEREVEELRDRYAAAVGGVRALQRALLADSVPVPPGFDVAARYVLASDDQAAGGDWFDAVARPDGSLMLVVGDVVGHGQAAAVAMGQLRSVLLSQLRAGARVIEAIAFLDGFAADVPAARRATVCVVHIQDDGEIEYCTAGHPPPLVLPANPTEEAAGRYLPVSGAGPLATGAEFVVSHAHLGVGDVVVLYSDGILERPGVSPAAASLELLATAGDAQHNRIMPVGAPASAAERICSLSIELLTRKTGYTDDITILAAGRRPAVPELDVTLEVGPGTARQARSALRSWLDEIDPASGDVEALLHAGTELIENVVDHAYLGHPAQPVRITAQLQPYSRVALDVLDTGSWKLPIVTHQRGRGLILARALVQELRIEASPNGTTVRIRHPLSRRAGLLDHQHVAHTQPDPEYFDVWADGGPEPVVRLIGPLDAGNVGEAGAYLDLALTEAGAVVTIDLTNLTLLASAGVDLLFRVVEQAQAAGRRVDLIAPNGCPAQHVLALVNLPHQQTRTHV